MAHIPLKEGVPGIRGLLAFRPETAKPLGDLAEVLMRGPSSLTRADREMIAAHVSYRNHCHFCRSSHAAIAATHLGAGESDFALLEQVQCDPESADIPEKTKALLAIAALVQADGRSVTDAAMTRARRAGATDVELHDTVLIAAAFCMFNRYVDGLGTWQPDDPAMYREFGRINADLGYVNRDYAAPVRSR
jgi:uncharacterized peroxidase-related enzyme